MPCRLGPGTRPPCQALRRSLCRQCTSTMRRCAEGCRYQNLSAPGEPQLRCAGDVLVRVGRTPGDASGGEARRRGASRVRLGEGREVACTLVHKRLDCSGPQSMCDRERVVDEGREGSETRAPAHALMSWTTRLVCATWETMFSRASRNATRVFQQKQWKNEPDRGVAFLCSLQAR